MQRLRWALASAACLVAVGAVAGATTTPATAYNPWGCVVTSYQPEQPWNAPQYLWARGTINCGQYKDVYVRVCMQWFDRVDQTYYQVGECADNYQPSYDRDLGAIVEHPCYVGRFRTWTFGHAQWPDGSGAWSDTVLSAPADIFC